MAKKIGKNDKNMTFGPFYVKNWGKSQNFDPILVNRNKCLGPVLATPVIFHTLFI
jgi:hypothetical protein